MTARAHLPTRRQIAVVRAIADELERCVAADPIALALEEQLAHELARLGCGSLEAAAALVEPDDGPAESGVYRRA